MPTPDEFLAAADRLRSIVSRDGEPIVDVARGHRRVWDDIETVIQAVLQGVGDDRPQCCRRAKEPCR